uniref:Uncharacterized protein n=1 Tax=Anguilla anguilla TaxID=7936 RepID=A0A0E9WNF2_ANGAN
MVLKFPTEGFGFKMQTRRHTRAHTHICAHTHTHTCKTHKLKGQRYAALTNLSTDPKKVN